LIQYRSVTDTHTHRHTTTAYTTLSIVSRGKNESFLLVNLQQVKEVIANGHEKLNRLMIAQAS